MNADFASPAALARRLLDVIEEDIVPLTREGVAKGNKIFGAAVLAKADLSVVVAETNNETENPLWHGEVHALKRFFEQPDERRPPTRDCILLSTHEPCSLCLSAITWAGFDVFYYLFGYEQTRDDFVIPHDLRILDEVFAVRDGNYVRSNAYWTSHGIRELIDGLADAERRPLLARIAGISECYAGLSDTYQKTKESTPIPLA